jgi:hypothetical protein
MINKEKLLANAQTLRHAVHSFNLHHIATHYPKAYFVVVLTAALAGYAFLMLFPVLGIVAITQLVDVAQSYPFSIDNVSQALVWIGVLIFSTAMSHHIFSMSFEPPKGITIPAAKAPKLFELIDNNQKQAGWLNAFGLLGGRFRRPMIHTVLLSEHFELAICKTPINGIPLWSKNTLVIGFPLMHTLPERYFNFAITRKLLQYSKGRNIVVNWLHQLQGIWFLYPKAFSRRKLLGEQLIVWFFRWYAPFYKQLSLYTAQRDELMADTLALQQINDSDLFKTIQSQIVAQYFYQKIYLPKLSNFIISHGGNPAKLNPYTTLSTAFQQIVNEERCKQWLEGFQQRAPGFEFVQSNTPAFSQRMHNIGQTRLKLPKLGSRSAAECYFGAHFAKTAHLMDTVWRNKIILRLKQQRNVSSRVQRPNLRVKAVAG